MRIEIVILLITGFIIANIYTDGKILKKALSYKKYYQMGAVVVGAFTFYWLVKKNPVQAQKMIMTSNEYLRYLPVDKNTSDMISPILDFTSKQNFVGYPDMGGGRPILPMSSENVTAAEQRILTSGKKATKRSVSETKKKFVAARQGWKCGDCNEQLSAWFEVDHKIRLEYGGSNHIDNLVALCRECHGKKTTIENL